MLVEPVTRPFQVSTKNRGVIFFLLDQSPSMADEIDVGGNQTSNFELAVAGIRPAGTRP